MGGRQLRRSRSISLRDLERLLFVLLLIGIVVAVLVLIFTGQEITPGNEGLYRFTFAIAAALIAFTLGGAVGLSWNFGGVAIRAGGAIAAFIIMIMWAPDLLSKVGIPRIELAAVNSVDFRSVVDPKTADWEASDVAITLESVSFASVTPTDLPAHLTSETINLAWGNQRYIFKPAWIVDLRKHSSGSGWLGEKGNWEPGVIEPNGLLNRSVMFVPYPRASLSWDKFILAMEADSLKDDVEIGYQALVSGYTLTWKCKLPIAAIKIQLAKARLSRKGLLPRYFEPTWVVDGMARAYLGSVLSMPLTA
ncbi:hypothetical protein LB524_28645 [Mesorhizobium sp. ESP6-5]|uniref:hypothetical protein n=1 Tax=Mesorhizobium sp. ESP6-5 TaxID=2876623 RepID=UPI001CCDAF10|nr:hypothetical protein [Mesorhizobium sp. ESP6-5]MBZ9759262.1 hypothetical protein [Mesorhizobium sp. ESP6-5]